MRQIIELTEEQKIAKHYSAMLDSVFMINDAIANPAKYTNDENVIQRNVEHLELMLAKDFWTTEDMAPVNAAIAAANAYTA
jgi:hypothetical protein